MPKIVLTDNLASISIDARPGVSFAQAIWLSGKFAPVSLCNGLGLCGNCRCRFLNNPPVPVKAEEQFFSEAQLLAGWRLACRHIVPDNTEICIELPPSSFTLQRPFTRTKKHATFTTAVMGIDLGTTSIQWKCVSLDKSRNMAGSQLNPQGAAGSDVISRLQYALSHCSELADLVLAAIHSFMDNAENAGLAVNKICIAANTAMTEILLKKDVRGLAYAPCALAFKGNEWLELELPDRKIKAYFPPLLAPFVGGDISAGLALLLDKPTPFLLIDMGTNAELALYTGEKLTIVSAPLGPALEGIGTSNGQLAGPGVITEFRLTPLGLEPLFYENKKVQEPVGISATGYISLIAILLRLGVLDASGKFNISHSMPLAKKLSSCIINNEFVPDFNFRLTLNDLDQLLKVKAIFRVALRKLMEATKLAPADIMKVYISGAISEYAKPEDLKTTGFLPPVFIDKLYMAGNTSLEGACLLARHEELIKRLAHICQNAHCVHLAEEKDFMMSYMDAMHWGQNGF